MEKCLWWLAEAVRTLMHCVRHDLPETGDVEADLQQLVSWCRRVGCSESDIAETIRVAAQEEE